jgi:hypothetical protein
MRDERCENCHGPKVRIGCRLNYHCIIASADCWSRSGVTLLTLLSIYARTENKKVRLGIGHTQNRAIMRSVNSVYTPRGYWYSPTGSTVLQ